MSDVIITRPWGYYYQEPVPGTDKNGKEVTCTRTVYMSYDDIVKVERTVLARAVPESRLVDEFVVTHRATIQQEDPTHAIQQQAEEESEEEAT